MRQRPPRSDTDQRLSEMRAPVHVNKNLARKRTFQDSIRLAIGATLKLLVLQGIAPSDCPINFFRKMQTRGEVKARGGVQSTGAQETLGLYAWEHCC